MVNAGTAWRPLTLVRSLPVLVWYTASCHGCRGCKEKVPNGNPRLAEIRPVVETANVERGRRRPRRCWRSSCGPNHVKTQGHHGPAFAGATARGRLYIGASPNHVLDDAPPRRTGMVKVSPFHREWSLASSWRCGSTSGTRACRPSGSQPTPAVNLFFLNKMGISNSCITSILSNPHGHRALLWSAGER